MGARISTPISVYPHKPGEFWKNIIHKRPYGQYWEEYEKVLEFRRNFHNKTHRALGFYYGDLFERVINLAKRLSKVHHGPRTKKGKRCMKLCMIFMMRLKIHWERERSFSFVLLMEELYGIDPKMALLVSDIVFGIVFDPRFNILMGISETSEFWRFFFGGQIKVSFLRKNPFCLKLFVAQYICANLNPRQRLLTTSGGFVNTIICKFLQKKPHPPKMLFK